MKKKVFRERYNNEFVDISEETARKEKLEEKKSTKRGKKNDKSDK